MLWKPGRRPAEPLTDAYTPENCKNLQEYMHVNITQRRGGGKWGAGGGEVCLERKPTRPRWKTIGCCLLLPKTV